MNVADWLLAARKYNFEFSSIEDEKYKTYCLHLYNISEELLENAADTAKRFRELSDDDADKEIPQEKKKDFIRELLDCDKIRADIEPYDEKKCIDSGILEISSEEEYNKIFYPRGKVNV